MAESYVVDERVGIAEPGSGVEFYFCPPHGKILEMLGRILLKENNEALNAIENGLIGVVVWRKSQLTSLSPNSTSSHHKRSSKKQHFSSRRHQESLNLKPNNVSPKQTTMPQSYFPVAGAHPPPEDDDADGDDDVPPGFGPSSTSRDDDDLPEFNFSGSANPPGFSSQNNNPLTPRGQPRPPSFHPVSQTDSRPVEQMRELVHKYGQNAINNAARGNLQERGFSTVPIQPWNDDDDDIPEWQPQAASQHQRPAPSHSQPPQVALQHQRPPPSQPPVRGFQQPTLRPHYMVNQQQQQQPVGGPPPLNVSQQGTWWGVPQQGHNNNNSSNLGGSHSNSGQFYGAFGRSPAPPSNPSNNKGF